MANIRKYWLVAALVLVVAVGMAIRETAPDPVHAAGSAPVTVQNTPLPVQGTVSVGNFPATQPVSGTVGISGTPTVKVSDTTPLPVTAADNPALQPFQAHGSANADSGGDCTVTFTGPGSGQRLVIEYVSVAINSNTTGTKLVSLIIGTTLNTFTVNHVLVPSYIADDGTFQTWEASQATRFYADPSTNVVMEARLPTSLAGAACYFAFSGHLVNVP